MAKRKKSKPKTSREASAAFAECPGPGSAFERRLAQFPGSLFSLLRNCTCIRCESCVTCYLNLFAVEYAHASVTLTAVTASRTKKPIVCDVSGGNQ